MWGECWHYCWRCFTTTFTSKSHSLWISRHTCCLQIPLPPRKLRGLGPEGPSNAPWHLLKQTVHNLCIYSVVQLWSRASWLYSAGLQKLLVVLWLTEAWPCADGTLLKLGGLPSRKKEVSGKPWAALEKRQHWFHCLSDQPSELAGI